MTDRTRGLTPDELSTPVSVFFSRFRWRPPAVDPSFTSARAFFERMTEAKPPPDDPERQA